MDPRALIAHHDDEALTPSSVAPTSVPKRRLDYIDQYRGFIMVSMILVNFLGDSSFTATPPFFKHGSYYESYPDTVMPGFLFAAGISYRLSQLNHIKKDGVWSARCKVLVPRALGLLIISYWAYGVGIPRLESWSDLQNTPTSTKADWFFYGGFFSALTQIALAMVWSLPVIDKSITVRVVYSIVSLWAYVAVEALMILRNDKDYHYADGEEGGPFGFLSWTFPLLAGSICYDYLSPVYSGHREPRLLPQEAKGDQLESIYDSHHNLAMFGAHDVGSTKQDKWQTQAEDAWQWFLGTSGCEKTYVSRASNTAVGKMVGFGFVVMAVGYLLSMLSVVVPFLCWNNATTQSADCDDVVFPSFPFIHERSKGDIITAWSMVECWPTFQIFNTGMKCMVSFTYVDCWLFLQVSRSLFVRFAFTLWIYDNTK
jgi:hypothetical protein